MSIPHGICGTEEVADYLRKLLMSELGGGDEVPNMPNWSLEFLEEAHYAVKLLLVAIKNKSKRNIHYLRRLIGIGSGQMSWLAADYAEALSNSGKRCTGMQENIEERLRRLFPPAATETIAEPCLVTDAEGNILLWFLPGLLGKEKQVNLHRKFV
jgi:hypothetical protein